MPSPTSLKPRDAKDLARVLDAARLARGELIPVVMVSSAHCPWCEVVMKEQLLPRLRSRENPEMALLVFDLADTTSIQIPTPSGPVRLTPKQWASQHGYRLAPTLVAINSRVEPIGQPLVGYASRDFYGAYLDDLIRSAQPAWKGLSR